MNILAIDTSADETSVAVVCGRKVLSHIEYSQILTHREWGGIVPSIAKRAHEERIDWVVEETMRKFGASFSEIDAVAVTCGPGLAIALEVGIRKAKELAKTHNKKLITVNHMEGHIYSCFAQNSEGNPDIKIAYPFLSLLISGGHTELVEVKNDLEYTVVGETHDDAAGEALDKAARLLGLGYPGGPPIERLAQEVGNEDRYLFPRPMIQTKEVEFSFSGLKTSFYYFLEKMDSDEKTKEIRYLASSFQEAVIDTLLKKTELAMHKTEIVRLAVGGGVSANHRLRVKLRALVKKHGGTVSFPPYPYLTGDNAAMIGIVAGFKAKKNIFVTDIDSVDRVPRLSLSIH